MMPTKRLYYADAFKLTHVATVTKILPENNAVELDETIFHPQGGGQPSDQGFIDGIEITKVVNSTDGSNVLHLLKDTPNFRVGDMLDLMVSQEPRMYFTRLHSAGHLIHNICEEQFPGMKAVKGHHFPNEASVEFTYLQEPDLDEFVDTMNRCLKTAINTAAPVVSAYDENTKIRSIKFADFEPSPCGGTHVSSLDQLGEIIIRGAKVVKDKSRNEKRVRLSYEVPTP